MPVYHVSTFQQIAPPIAASTSSSVTFAGVTIPAPIVAATAPEASNAPAPFEIAITTTAARGLIARVASSGPTELPVSCIPHDTSNASATTMTAINRTIDVSTTTHALLDVT